MNILSLHNRCEIKKKYNKKQLKKRQRKPYNIITKIKNNTQEENIKNEKLHKKVVLIYFAKLFLKALFC